MRDDRPKLLYLMGFSRSGTTVLANALGSIDGFASVGELSSHVWERVVSTRPCGCGSPVAECEFWQAVFDDALGEMPGEARAGDLRAQERKLLRTRHIPRYLRRPAGDPGPDPELRDYVETLDKLYVAAARRSGARVVVDASKRPPDAAGVRLAPSVETYFVHVVRDPRAVAHSWMRPAVPGLTQYRPRQVAWRWMRINAAALAVHRAAGERSLLVRYEDFVRDPRGVLESIVRLTDEPVADLPILADGRLKFEPNHIVAGNPRHSDAGVIELKADDEWVDVMPRSQRALVTTVSSPLLRLFRYHWGPSPVGPASA